MLTQERLKELFHYDPDTGVFTWLKCSGKASAGSVAGYVDSLGYRVIRVYGKAYKAHRLAFLYMTGSCPYVATDHINGLKDDNRFVNLRSVTVRQNNMNSPRSKSNRSGIVGVGWLKDKKRWRATITVDGRLIYIGVFSDVADAAAARKQAEIDHGFHPNHGREACTA
jgi:hypothetical protein